MLQYGSFVTGQPMAGAGPGWMPAPQAPPNCPPGLEYLCQVDQLLVKQKIEGLESKCYLTLQLTPFET